MPPESGSEHAPNDGNPSVAILHSQDLIDEWLDHLDLSLDDLRHHLVGSWIFGYAEALGRAEINTTFIFITQQVRKPERTVHTPTGSVIWLVPPPRSFLWVRHTLKSDRFRDRWLAAFVVRHLLPYLATPPSSVARILRAEGCNAIICQEYECPRFDIAVLLGRRIGIPVFPCFHGGDGRSGLEGLLHPITVRACAGIIISADVEARRVRDAYGIPWAKLARIPNPIDVELWRPEGREETRIALGIPKDALVIVWHGAVYLQAKGLDLLVEAWERVTRARPHLDLRLLLVGGGKDAGQLEQLMTGIDQPGIHFMNGWVHDRRQLRSYLSASDLYVLSSRSEGYPNALLEAMACGLPVVATDIAGVPDIVGRDDNAAGLLIRPNDSEALATGLGHLLDDDILRGQFAARARLRVDEQFSLDVVGSRMRDFFTKRGMRKPNRRGVSVQ